MVRLSFDTPVPPLFRGNGGGLESGWLSIPAACSWSRFLFQVVSLVCVLKIVGWTCLMVCFNFQRITLVFSPFIINTKSANILNFVKTLWFSRAFGVASLFVSLFLAVSKMWFRSLLEQCCDTSARHLIFFFTA